MIRFVHAHVILPDQDLKDASVLVEDGIITAIDGTNPIHCHEIDCEGAWLLPGLIDLHCDAIEKEVAPRPSVLFPFGFAIAQVDRRNAVAGITTPFHALSFSDDELGIRNNNTAAEVCRAVHAHRGLVDNRVHCRYEITDEAGLDPLLSLIEDGTMDLLSFMDHTPGQGQFRTLESYERYMMGAYKISQEEARSVADAKLHGAVNAANRVERLAHAAREHGISLASHDDDSADRIATMQALGSSMSEFPINLETARAAHQSGLLTILGSPNVVRGGSQSGNMRALDAIIDGCCDCLCADYHPATLIQAVLMLPSIANISPSRAIAMATANPAKAAGLTDRGRIAVGLRADLIAARLDQGTALVETTMVAGRVVMQASRHQAAAAAVA
jgi:alpha-D-ribose 1-methylphosphonate 5-triphosphate diphosphatase